MSAEELSVKEQEETPVVETPVVETPAAETTEHMPGQVEPVVEAPKSLEEIPAEGNNIASVQDRAYADTPPANDQPPVEKTFVGKD